jgi:ubiquinone/menaquinone biosynthesis C-methylase UbiE
VKEVNMTLLENEVELVTELCTRLRALAEQSKQRGATPLTVLELGCGTGKLALHLHELLPEAAVIGIDPDRSKVAKAQQHSAALSFSVQSAEQLGVKPQVFDVLVSLKALHEFPRPQAALKEAHRVLRVEGRIYLIDWIRGVPATAGHCHVPKYFFPERLTDVLAATGFTGVTLTADREAGLMLAEAAKHVARRADAAGVAGGDSHGRGDFMPRV